MDAYEHRLAISRRFGERIAAGDAVFMTGGIQSQGAPCTMVGERTRLLSGINRLMLQQVMRDMGWRDPRFFTQAQIQEQGWTVQPDAKRVRLQYLVSTDSDGVVAPQPVVHQFWVTNATQIQGVAPWRGSDTPQLADVQAASMAAGYPCASQAQAVRTAVDQWLQASTYLDPYRAVPGAVALRVRLAGCFLEAQSGLPGAPMHEPGLVQHWLQAIQKEPLALFYAVKDAELMAADIAQEIALQQFQRKNMQPTMTDLSNTVKTPASEGRARGSAASTSPELKAKFAAREAVLAVPYDDRERVKQLGALWYPEHKLWFVPQGVKTDRFQEWSTSGHLMGAVASNQVVLDDFRKAMNDMGFDDKAEIKDDGKWHNVRVNSKKGNNRAGAYRLDLEGGEDGGPVGFLNNKHTGEEMVWRYDGPMLTPEQRAHMRAKAREREALAQQELRELQDQASVHAKEIVAAAIPAHQHGYVLKKGISAEGLGMVKGSLLLQYEEFYGESGATAVRPNDWYLVVPMSTHDGELRAVQAINEDGSVKTFMRGAQKQGTSFVLGGASVAALIAKNVPAVAWVEGVATGASFQAASGLPTVVCFDAGNLEKVASGDILRLPETMRAILAVDNDQFHVERAVGMLAQEIGLNPYGRAGGRVSVLDGRGQRSVSLGDAIADGQWHQAPKGKYSITLELEAAGSAVREIHLQLVPDAPGRKMTASFGNRGVEAGRKVLETLEQHAGKPAQIQIATPAFATLAGRPTDWNDLTSLEGLAAARAVLNAQGIGLQVQHHAVRSEPLKKACQPTTALSR